MNFSQQKMLCKLIISKYAAKRYLHYINEYIKQGDSAALQSYLAIVIAHFAGSAKIKITTEDARVMVKNYMQSRKVPLSNK